MHRRRHPWTISPKLLHHPCLHSPEPLFAARHSLQLLVDDREFCYSQPNGKALLRRPLENTEKYSVPSPSNRITMLGLCFFLSLPGCRLQPHWVAPTYSLAHQGSSPSQCAISQNTDSGLDRFSAARRLYGRAPDKTRSSISVHRSASSAKLRTVLSAPASRGLIALSPCCDLCPPMSLNTAPPHRTGLTNSLLHSLRTA